MTDELRDRLQATLGETCTLERELSGGMSRVFIAHDSTLNRRVVVKVLPGDPGAGVSVERFRREILLAAGLQHPHIVPVLASGETGGVPFYSMPFVEGESLRDRLHRDRRLPIAEALRIAREVAGALEYAHATGIVHRDIKPENILLSRGHALVTDFGVACALATPSSQTLTQAGFALGTPAYMSPEQVTGDRDVDGRSDVYSLGCVLFEMLAGDAPFSGPTAQAVIAKRLTEPAPAVRRLRDDVPPPIESALERALAREPADRFPSAAAFAAALEDAGQRSGGADRSLAVLPFASVSPDPDDAFFADGLTEEIITDLSRVNDLRVISRNSAMRYKGTDKNAPAIGRELNVRYLLEGSTRRAGASLRVTAQLVEAETDSQIWAERFTGTMADVFEIQEQIARQIVEALKVRLSPEEDRRLHVRTIENVQAFEWYLRARQLHLQFTEPALVQGLDLVDRALALEGERAPLVALKGTLLWNLHNVGARGAEALREASALVDRAIALDPGRAETLVARALIEQHAGRMDAGLVMRLLRRACDGERHADAHAWLTVFLCQTGRPELAVPYARTAEELDPLSPTLAVVGAWPYLFLGRFDEARARARAGAAIDPGHQVTAFFAAHLVLTSGDFAEARAQFGRIAPDGIWGHFNRMYLHALDQDRETTLRVANDPETAALVRVDDQYCWFTAQALSHCGWQEEALGYLRQAAERAFVNAGFVREIDRTLIGLRTHPGFPALLAFMETRAAEIARDSGL